MPDQNYTLSITIDGRDNASGPLGGVLSSLQRIGEFALGGLLARGLAELGQNLAGMARDAVQAAADMQVLTVSLETLAAREIARGQEVNYTRQVSISLSQEERNQLAGLAETRSDLTNRYELEKIRLTELNARRDEAIATYGAESIQVQELNAQITIQTDKTEDLKYRIDQTGGKIDALNAKEGQLATVSYAVREGTMSIAEAMGQAGPRAQELLAQLRDVSLTSPYEWNVVAQAFRVQMAFGATSESAMGLTKAILDTGAGLGLTADMMQRMTYNLAQALQQGDLTAANLRQLKMVGLDLADVFETELNMSIEDVRAALQSGQMTAEDVSKAFMDYAENNFGGAAERLSRTFSGLKSSFSDLFTFSSADLLSPALQAVSDALGAVFDHLRTLMESGAFARLGEQLGQLMTLILGDGDQLIGLADRMFNGLTSGIGVLTDLARLFLPVEEGARGAGEELIRLGPNIVEMDGAVDQSAQRFDALTGALARFIGEDAAAGVVSFLSGTLIPGLRDFFGQVREFIDNHGPAFRGALVGVAIALGALAIAGVIAGLLSALANPIVLIIGLAGALGAAWATNFGGIRDKVGQLAQVWQQIWPRIQAVFVTVWTVIQSIVQAVVDTIWPTIQTMIENVRANWGPFWESLKPILETVAAAIGAILTFLIGVVTGIVNGIISAIGPLIQAFTDIFNGIWQILQGIWTFIGGFLQLLYGLFTGNGDLIKQAWGTMWEGIKQIAEGVWNTIVGAISGFVNVVFSFIGGLIDGIINFFVNLYNTLVGNSIIPDLINGIIAWFFNLPTALLDLVRQAVEWVIGKFIEFLTWISTVDILAEGERILQGLWDGLQNIWTLAWGWLSTLLQPLLDYLDGIDLLQVGKDILQGLWDGMVSIWNSVVTWFQGALEDLPEWVKKILGIASPSTVMFGLGANATLGFQKGMESVALKPPIPDFALAGGAEGAGSTFDQRSYGGDVFNVQVRDRGAAGMLLAMVEERRRQRLNAFMGA